MIQGKLYELMAKYAGDFLYGFDKSNLEVALLSGNFILRLVGYLNLKNVNLKPGKINEILAKLKVPIVIKSGILGKLQLKVLLLAL